MGKEDKFDGYLYTQSLCSAIEEYTTSEEQKESSTFIYRNANLRFAVERALYFAFANNNNLFETFGEWKYNKLPERIVLSNNLEKEILLNMCDIDPNIIYITQPKLFYRFKYKLKIVIKFFILISYTNHIVRLIRRFINIWSSRKKQHQILFVIRSERFVKYLRPISDKIQIPFSYVTYNKKTARYLKEQKLPYIKASKFGYFIERWTHSKSIINQFGISDQYDWLFDIIDITKPLSVVVVEGNAPHDEIVNQICKQINTESVCIQQGWSPIVHNGFRNMTYSKMLVWGDGFAKDLAKYNPNQEFVSTGSHIIKLSDNKTTKRPGDKIRVGFLPPMPTKILSEDNYSKFMELVPWIANKFKDIEIIISEHPTIINNERFKEIANYDNVKFLSSKTHSLQEIIEGNDISVSFFSTTILESIASGSLPIIVNLTSMPHHLPDVNTHGAGIEVRNIDEAKTILTDLINNPEKISGYKPAMDKFKKEYFAFDRDIAIKNIVKELTHY